MSGIIWPNRHDLVDSRGLLLGGGSIEEEGMICKPGSSGKFCVVELLTVAGLDRTTVRGDHSEPVA